MERLQRTNQRFKDDLSGSNRRTGIEAFAHFEDIRDNKYPYIGQSWRRHWENLSTFFVYPQDIRKAIYTTNAIESLNSVIRHAIKKRKVFPTDDSVKKGHLFRDAKSI